VALAEGDDLFGSALVGLVVLVVLVARRPVYGGEVEHERGLVEAVDLERPVPALWPQFDALAGVPLTMFSLGRSGLNLSIVVEDRDADRAIRSIHQALFEAPVGVG
jgi:hypothetical protein